MIVYSDRTEFVGAHVRPDVKDDMRRAVKRSRVSMSAWISEAIVEKLENESMSSKPATDMAHTVN